jgi:hypothetical protein
MKSTSWLNESALAYCEPVTVEHHPDIARHPEINRRHCLTINQLILPIFVKCRKTQTARLDYHRVAR